MVEEFQEKAILAKAKKERYTPLTRIETRYIHAAIQYNIDAKSPSMNHQTVSEAAEAWEELNTLSSPERISELDHLINWYTDGGERCDYCDGMGYIDDVDSGHDYECPECEGFGYVNDVEIDED